MIAYAVILSLKPSERDRDKLLFVEAGRPSFYRTVQFLVRQYPDVADFPSLSFLRAHL